MNTIVIEHLTDSEKAQLLLYVKKMAKTPQSKVKFSPGAVINPIDNVTTELLDVACRMCKIHIDSNSLDKIIDLVELIEQKGELVSIKDISILQDQWDNQPKP